MEFITVEQFKEQPAEVQKVFLDWWETNLSEVDLIGYIGKSEAYKECFPSLVRNVAVKCFEMGIEIIPLFTEGQLRKFIEDKLNIKVQSMFDLFSSEYALLINAKGNMLARTGTEDLFQAYWEVACMVTKEVE